MNTSDLVEWQIRSPKNGMIMAWWTHPILEFIETLDWKDKTMLETGAGKNGREELPQDNWGYDCVNRTNHNHCPKNTI